MMKRGVNPQWKRRAASTTWRAASNGTASFDGWFINSGIMDVMIAIA
jgi:hypothetical protein